MHNYAIKGTVAVLTICYRFGHSGGVNRSKKATLALEPASLRLKGKELGVVNGG